LAISDFPNTKYFYLSDVKHCLKIIFLTLLLIRGVLVGVSASGTQDSLRESPDKRYHPSDSMKAVIEAATHDTSVCNAYLRWGQITYMGNPDTAVILFHKARETAERHLPDQSRNPATSGGKSQVSVGHHSGAVLHQKYLSSLAEALNNIGYIYHHKGDISAGLKYYHKCIKIHEELSNSPDIAKAKAAKNGLALALNNIGTIYDDQGDIEKGLKFYHKSLKIQEEIGDEYGVALALNNIGYVYQYQGDIAKGLECYNKCLKIYEEIGDKNGIAHALNDLGHNYMSYGDPSCTASKESCIRESNIKALEYYNRSLKITEAVGNKNGAANSLNHIGYLYKTHGDPSCNLSTEECLELGITKGLEYFLESLSLREEIGEKKEVASSLNNIGGTYLVLGEFRQAKIYGDKMMELSQELGNPNLISYAASMLNRIATKSGHYKEALEMYELHILMRDSIKNEETQKATIRQQMNYEFEKAQLLKEQEEKEAARIATEITERRDNLQYSIVLIFLLILATGLMAMGRLSIPIHLAEGLIFFSFLIFFEFLLVLADPYIETWSAGAPGIKLLFNAVIAGTIFPLHSFFETNLKRRLVR